MVDIISVRALSQVKESDLTDDEIQVFIDLDDDVYRTSANVARAMASKLAGKVNVRVGPVSISNSDRAKVFLSIARGLMQAAREGGDLAFVPVLTGTSVSAIDAANQDDDRFRSKFYRGVTDNPDTNINDERRRVR